MSPKITITIETFDDTGTNREVWDIEDGSVEGTIIYALIKGCGKKTGESFEPKVD